MLSPENVCPQTVYIQPDSFRGTGTKIMTCPNAGVESLWLQTQKDWKAKVQPSIG